MPTKFPELFIDEIVQECETITKFLDVFNDNISNEKLILKQFPTKVLRT